MYPNPTDPLNGDAASLCEYLEAKYDKDQIFWIRRHRLTQTFFCEKKSIYFFSFTQA